MKIKRFRTIHFKIFTGKNYFRVKIWKKNDGKKKKNKFHGTASSFCKKNHFFCAKLKHNKIKIVNQNNKCLIIKHNNIIFQCPIYHKS